MGKTTQMTPTMTTALMTPVSSTKKPWGLLGYINPLLHQSSHSLNKLDLFPSNNPDLVFHGRSNYVFIRPMEHILNIPEHLFPIK